MGLRYMPIMPSFKISPKVLEILILGSNGMVRLNISPQGMLLFLDGPEGSMDISLVLGGGRFG